MDLDKYIQEAIQLPSKVVAIAAAEDEEVIEAVVQAVEMKLATFILYGNEEKITNLLVKSNASVLTSSCVKIVDAKSDKEAAQKAVQGVNEGAAQILMKGMVSTSIILKEVLNKDYGLRAGNVLSHIAAFQVPGYDSLLFVTDAAMNIAPDLQQKVEIINNAVNFVRSLRITLPKVAVVSAVETVNPNIGTTVDAAILTQMNKRGQIKNCFVDGPLGLDNAISIEAAKIKGLDSEVAGRADIIMVPSIEVGNILYKSLIYFAGAKVGAVIVGAKSPIVLTSRADTAENKLNSIALAVRSVS